MYVDTVGAVLFFHNQVIFVVLVVFSRGCFLLISTALCASWCCELGGAMTEESVSDNGEYYVQ